MKTALKPLGILAAALLLAACDSTDPQKQTLKYTAQGRLSELTQLPPDYNSTSLHWRLRVDTAGLESLKGECTWTGYLGDSVLVAGQTARPGLYTNDSMTATKSAAEFHESGVILSRDTVAQPAHLSHYRADFDCEY